MKSKKVLIILLIFSTTFLFSYLYINYDNVFIESNALASKETPNSIVEETKEKEASDDNIAIADEEAKEETSKEETIKNEDKVEEKVTNEPVPVPKKETPPKKTETSKPVTNPLDSIKNDQGKMGDYGRLYISSVNLSVAVYNANIMAGAGYNAQQIVDAKDSAAFYPFGNSYVIADHNYQGFNKIINLSNNAKAYLKKSDGSIITYTMTKKYVGKNTKVDLIDENGISVKEQSSDLIMYTCYGDNSIMITLWNLDN